MGNSIKFSAICNRGKVRQNNQDKIYISDTNLSENTDVSITGNSDAKIFTAGIFDGMGGEVSGDKAAEIAVETMQMNDKADFNSLCSLINKKICEYMKENRILRMGTTAALVRINKDCADICNIGDSKIYLIDEAAIKQISVDHAETIGRMRPRRVLTQHLGIPEIEMLIEPYCNKIELNKGEKLLLCSDGLTDMVTEKEIYSNIKETDAELCAETLFNAAMLNGGRDNISIIVCEKE